MPMGGGQGAKTGLYLVIGSTQKNAFIGDGTYSPCLTSSMGTGGGHVPITVLGNVNPSGRGQNGNVYSTTGLAPTVTTNKGEGLKIIDADISYCITASYQKGTSLEDYFRKGRRQLFQDDDLKIRRLTPLECFRLMGFTDEDFAKIKKVGISDSQAYKQAGNSIVVNVIEAIFRNLFLEEEVSEYKLF